MTMMAMFVNVFDTFKNRNYEWQPFLKKSDLIKIEIEKIFQKFI